MVSFREGGVHSEGVIMKKESQKLSGGARLSTPQR